VKLKEKYRLVLEYFKKERPLPETELDFGDPFGLVVAVILSAQCTDKRVNMITPALLKAFPDAASMAAAGLDDIFGFIKSCSFPNNKARHLKEMASVLAREFGGKVPEEPDQLMKLPGVGRKTANVIASVIYRKPVISVDTHVFRVARRIGLTPGAKTPLMVEKKLTRYIEPSLRHNAHHWLILHGRYTCQARKPKCKECGLTGICSYYLKKQQVKGKSPEGKGDSENHN